MVPLTRWQRFRMWLAGWADWRRCDGCRGSFPTKYLGAVSGDWWLCRKCFDRYIA